MLGRLIVGILKGLVVGGLVGFGLFKLGFFVLPAWLAYIAAAITGILIGLVAGKPIWAKDAKIEAGMKAVVGALLGAGLMFVARKWLGFQMPVDLKTLADANTSLGETNVLGSFGGLAVTSLAFVAAVLGGFYEVDNTPDAAGDDKAEGGARVAEGKDKARIAAASEGDEEDLDEVADPKHAKKR